MQPLAGLGCRQGTQLEFNKDAVVQQPSKAPRSCRREDLKMPPAGSDFKETGLSFWVESLGFSFKFWGYR